MAPHRARERELNERYWPQVAYTGGMKKRTNSTIYYTLRGLQRLTAAGAIFASVVAFACVLITAYINSFLRPATGLSYSNITAASDASNHIINATQAFALVLSLVALGVVLLSFSDARTRLNDKARLFDAVVLVVLFALIALFAPTIVQSFVTTFVAS